MASNYPPGFSDGYQVYEDVSQECELGHKWTANMYTELGGFFFCNDDNSACPECGNESVIIDGLDQRAKDCC
jgi:hypothetical protein